MRRLGFFSKGTGSNGGNSGGVVIDAEYKKRLDLALDHIESQMDTDNDGINDKQERELGTNPYSKDTDNDGYDDKLEQAVRTNATDSTSKPDADTLFDYYADNISVYGSLVDGRLSYSAYRGTDDFAIPMTITVVDANDNVLHTQDFVGANNVNINKAISQSQVSIYVTSTATTKRKLLATLTATTSDNEL